MPEKFRLQLLSHEDLFDTREDAMDYLDGYFKPSALQAEPCVVFYGDTKNPKAVFAIGIGNRKVAYFDNGQIEEAVENSGEKVDNINDLLMHVIKASGLTYYNDGRSIPVEYTPDKKDEIIGNAEDFAQAISLLSKAVQGIEEQGHLEFEDTKTIKLVLDETDGKKVLKGKVKVSKYGDEDDEDFNNNIIGTFSDGIYAAVNLEYDDEKNTLTFTSSGLDKNGKLKTNANKKVISLGKHTKFTAKNGGHNVKVTITDSENGEPNVISADVKISEAENNILTMVDNKLFVDGRAKNIKYKDSDVFEAINGLQTDIENFKLEVNKGKNVLKLTIGDKTEKVELPGVSLFEDAEYDPTTKSIVVKFKDGSKITIPVGDLLSANSYKIAHNNTTVGEKLDELDAQQAKTVQDLIGEINSRTAQANEIITKIEQEVKDREHADEDIIHLIDDVKKEFDITDLREELKKFQEGYAEFEKEWAVYRPQIEKAISEAESVAGRVTKLEQDFAITNTNLTNLTDRVATAEGNINNNASKIADNTLAITNEATLARQNENDIKTALEKEVTRSTAKDDELSGLIATNKGDIDNLKTTTAKLQSDFTTEVERAKGEETRIEGLVNVNKEAIAENKNSIGVISTSVAGLRNELENEITRAKGEETRIEGKIDALSDSSTAATNNALEQAKNYTDAEITKAKTTAAEDATSKANQSLADAKTYSDEKLALEVARAQAAEQANATVISEIKTKNTEIETSLANKVENVRIEKNSQNDLQYTLYVDDKPAGEINIPEDQFLENARYDVGTKSLVFTWKIGEKHPETTIDVSDFITLYYAGSGLQMSDNTFSVKLTTANETYLQLTTDGLQLVGINAKFDTKADKADVYTKLEVDNAIEAEAIRAKGVEQGLQNSIDTTNGNVSDLTGRVSDTEGKLNVIQGNSAQEGSIEYALAKAKEYAEGLAGGEQSRAELAEKKIADDAKSYTDGKVAQLEPRVAANESAITNLNGTIADNLREAKEYADTKVSEVNTKADNNASEITQLKKDVASLEPNVTETNSVKMTMNKAADGTTFSSDVKLDLEKQNILKISGNGIYAEVSLDYNTSENKLVFMAGGVTKDIQLAGASMIEDAYYNSATRQIVFVVVTHSGETKQVTIDVNDLVNTLRIENPANSPVQLTLTQNPQGNDLLSANLIISTKEDNLILADNGTLFASKRAANMTALWEDNLDTNLQIVINNLKARTDIIQNDIINIKSDIAGNTTKITQLETRLDNYDITINQLQQDIKKIQDTLGDGSGEGGGILDRIAKLEYFIENNLIDFGTL